MKSVEDKYAELEEIIGMASGIDTLEWILNYDGTNEETLEWVAGELGEDIDGMGTDEQVEYLSDIMDRVDTDPLEWITNCSGFNDDVLDWVAEQVGHDFNDD